MSFVTQDDVFNAIEPVLHGIFEEFANGRTVSAMPFARIPFRESMLKYGSDKPDLRNPIIIGDVTEHFRTSGFGLFEGIVGGGDVVRAIPAPNSADKSRKFFTDMNDWARAEGHSGLGYVTRKGGEFGGPIAKNHGEEGMAALYDALGLGPDDGCFFSAGKELQAAKLAGAAVQVLLTPVAVPGTPVTAQVGAVAASGPRLVQLVTTVTGVPCVTVCVTAPVALMSAVATGVVTQRGSPATQAGGGVVQLEGEAVVQPGGGVVVLSVMTLVKLVVPVGSGVPTVTVKLAVAVPPAGTLAMVRVHRNEPVTVPAQFVVAPVKPAGKVALVFAGISSKKLTGPAVPPVLVAVKA